MSIYDVGWLSKFLNPGNQPDKIKEYFQLEDQLLLEHIAEGASIVDFGCGFGRHLELLAGNIHYGLGIDINESDIRLGQRNLRNYSNIELKVADCRNPKLERVFDYAICMNNTLGNIEEREKVILEMGNAIRPGGAGVLAVYAPDSVQPRIEWYERTGLKIKKVAKDHIQTEEEFKSYHFTKSEIKRLVGDSDIIEIGDVGYFVIFV